MPVKVLPGARGVYSGSALWTEETADNVQSGTFTSGAWRTRTLTNERYNNISGSSLSSNQVTLPAGDYVVHAWSEAYDVYRHQARLWSITDAALVPAGFFSPAYTGAATGTSSGGVCKVTFEIETIVELQSHCQQTQATNGFGVFNSTHYTVEKNCFSSLYVVKLT